MTVTKHKRDHNDMVKYTDASMLCPHLTVWYVCHSA